MKVRCVWEDVVVTLDRDFPIYIKNSVEVGAMTPDKNINTLSPLDGIVDIDPAAGDKTRLPTSMAEVSASAIVPNKTIDEPGIVDCVVSFSVV